MNDSMVLITGATSGIGKELATLFAKNGNNLLLIARSPEELKRTSEELEKLSQGMVATFAIDLSLPEAPQKVFELCVKHKYYIETLVNNAGFATSGKFWSIPYEQEADEIAVNITTLTLLTKLFLPSMIAHHKGRILNIASTAAFLPGPYMSVYFASKAYVLSFSQALREELRGTGVSVTTLCPGATNTKFASRANVEKTPLFRGKLLTPERVAKAGYEGLLAGRDIVFADPRSAMIPFLARLAPRSLTARLAKRTNSPT